MESTNPSRRILLAVTGLSPQVVTETVYALASAGPDPWVPDEIHLITTREGAERARLALLSDEPGWFHRLRHDYRLPTMAFDTAHIHVLTDADGRALDDIRTPTDNERAADQITDHLRRLTADPGSEVHVSIAGGRKTMGYYLGYALSLFGRPQDRLSHVLVSEPFESSWDFFYPTPYSRVITTRDNKLADTRDAQVTLAEIPFVRLRDGVPSRLLEGHAHFSDTVNAAQRALGPASLLIDLAHHRVVAAGENVPMEPADLAFYALMARRRKSGRHAITWHSERLAADYLAEYAALVNPMSGDYERVETALKDGATKEWFEQRKAKTNAALKRALGEALAKRYLIEAQGQRPNTRFGLTVDVAAIGFDSGKPAGSAPATPMRTHIENPSKQESE